MALDRDRCVRFAGGAAVLAQAPALDRRGAASVLVQALALDRRFRCAGAAAKLMRMTSWHGRGDVMSCQG